MKLFYGHSRTWIDEKHIFNGSLIDKNHSVSRGGIDVNNVCQPNRTWIGMSYNEHSYHTRICDWGRFPSLSVRCKISQKESDVVKFVLCKSSMFNESLIASTVMLDLALSGSTKSSEELSKLQKISHFRCTDYI